MDNDKAFMIYSVALIAGVTSVITASVLAGQASLPSLGVFVEHLALSVGFRGAYKSFGGFEWLYSLGRFTGAITVPSVMGDSMPDGAAHA